MGADGGGGGSNEGDGMVRAVGGLPAMGDGLAWAGGCHLLLCRSFSWRSFSRSWARE